MSVADPFIPDFRIMKANSHKDADNNDNNDESTAQFHEAAMKKKKMPAKHSAHKPYPEQLFWQFQDLSHCDSAGRGAGHRTCVV